MSLYDPLYHQKRAAKLADAKLAAEDALMRKPSPTAALNLGSRATAFGRSKTPTVVRQRAAPTVPVTARSTIRSTQTPATTAVQPLTASSRTSTTAAQRRTPVTSVATAPSSTTTDAMPASAASTTTTEAILGQLRSEVATLQAQVVILQASLNASMDTAKTRTSELDLAHAQHDADLETLGTQLQASRDVVAHLEESLEVSEHATATGASDLALARSELAASRAQHDDDIKALKGNLEEARQAALAGASEHEAVVQALHVEHEKALAAKGAEFRDKYEDAVRGRRVVCPACSDVDEWSQWAVFDGPLLEDTDFDSDMESLKQNARLTRRSKRKPTMQLPAPHRTSCASRTRS
ncbi:hypothetical protein SDRG_10270 [Saprolegnia diclina VS20]|uniref:Uncharacterized protein n=1 Tax=Saprolegnia diclina (strain VS20) TaxID=1156394 RepID=T0RIC8_SAPDV|nr:hypothetical protein SDRG_10270 [Saprolegnia diclina VS20]EQC32073.1 hypothetical protein SDRG_10270 [Saprolegnia diclina VS20]|eukprot:XP_008614475.1 hypothetical protein SDRG_10270 [Saprolegnia diclina VS20]